MPAIAGVAYAVAWIVGLAIHPSGPAIDDPARKIVQDYVDHRAAAIVQSILIHGVAALALVGVVAGLRAITRRTGEQTAGTVAFLAGVVAATISLVQMVLGISLGASANLRHPHHANSLFDAINRLDGVKMLALAVVVGAGVLLATRGLLARWLAFVGVVLVVALTVAAIGYLMLSAALATAAIVALILLIIWITSAGITSANRSS